METYSLEAELTYRFSIELRGSDGKVLNLLRLMCIKHSPVVLSRSHLTDLDWKIGWTFLISNIDDWPVHADNGLWVFYQLLGKVAKKEIAHILSLKYLKTVVNLP